MINKNREIYEHIIELFYKEQNTRIILKKSINNEIMPCVDIQNQSIQFNDRLETMMMLFDLFMNNKHTGGNAIHHFLLNHLAIQRNMYGKAEELLALLSKDIEGLRDTLKNKEAYNTLIVLQTSIALCHDLSHVYYAQHPDMRDNNIKDMKRRLVHYKEKFNADKPFAIWLLQIFSKKLMRMQEHAFEEAIGDVALLEEFCCDEAAWKIVRNIIGLFDFDADSIALLCAHVGLSFAFIATKQTFESIYLNPDKDIMKRNLHFDNSWHLMQNYIIWEHIDKENNKTSKYFRTLINDYERMGRVMFMLTMRENINHIDYIRLMPPMKYSLEEVKRLDALYGEMEIMIKSYKTSE